jgi:multiple antibiotic resistance protein
MFNLQEILSVSLILFAVIDMLGNVPWLLKLRNRHIDVQPGKATLASGVIMVAFLFLGEELLRLMGIGLPHFAVAGSVVIFLIGLGMILGREFMHIEKDTHASSIVPLAFPLIAGAGTLVTLLSIRTSYAVENILVGIAVNLAIVYVVLRTVPTLAKWLGRGGIDVLSRAFGVILLALAVKLASGAIPALISTPMAQQGLSTPGVTLLH